MSHDKKKTLFFSKIYRIIIFCFFLFFSSTLFAAENLLEPKEQTTYQIFSSKNIYQPYFELGGAKYFHQSSSVAGIYDLFIPLLQQEDQLLFTDLRIFDRSGTQCEGNLHLGFRKLFPESNQMFGIYGSFDLKKSAYGNNFKQITFGLEYWLNKFFVGGNFYQPIGKNTQSVPEFGMILSDIYNEKKLTKRTSIFVEQNAEKAMMGVDIEVGYAPDERLTGYAGVYYFGASNVDVIYGPKARITYEYMQPTGRMLKVFDGVSLELGGQHDKRRGYSGYVGIKFKIGLTNFVRNSNVQGFARHMVELVRRDQDIVIEKTNTPQMVQTITTEEVEMTDEDMLLVLGVTRGVSQQELARKRKQIRDLYRLDKEVSNNVYERYEKFFASLMEESRGFFNFSWQSCLYSIVSGILGGGVVWLTQKLEQRHLLLVFGKLGGQLKDKIYQYKIGKSIAKPIISLELYSKPIAGWIADTFLGSAIGEYAPIKTEIPWDWRNYSHIIISKLVTGAVLTMFFFSDIKSAETILGFLSLGIAISKQISDDIFGRSAWYHGNYPEGVKNVAKNWLYKIEVKYYIPRNRQDNAKRIGQEMNGPGLFRERATESTVAAFYTEFFIKDYIFSPIKKYFLDPYVKKYTISKLKVFLNS